MKKIVFILIAFLAFANVNSQMLDPVKWTTKIEKKSENTFVLVFDAVLEKDWHMYSQFTPDGGPLQLEVSFKNQKGNFNLVGKAKESKTRTAYNDIFEVNETFFEGKAQIKQEITITNTKLTTVEAVLNYQVCKEVCINQEKKFSFTIPSISMAATPAGEATPGIATTTIAKDSITSDSLAPSLGESNVYDATDRTKETVAIPTEDTTTARGLWSIFFIAFFSGFAALLTPCVFPMIPMTVSFFTKQSKTRAAGIRNAIIYGISIIVIYVILGFLVTWIFGAGALNALSTNVWFNIIFFVLLVVFASSFLGAFEIMLPNSWANKVDSQADRGIAPVIGMLGFSLALALPFMLFAMFPGWLNSLPKSGGWLNTVKVVLGFLELALAFKFLSNADLVLQLHFLEREVFLAIWIAIFGTLAFYLFGKITLPHDSPLTHISVGRLIMGLLVLSFTVYMIPGLWGAPLKLISAFPPTVEYSESPKGLGGASAINTTILPEGAKLGPHGIMVFEDYEKGVAYAKTVNKPILLDFTGYACVNCRKMENNVWSDDTILPILSNEVVLISLYVDDKRDLPKEEQFVSKTTGSEIETVGDKWTDFMITKTNTQPLYVLTDSDGNSLNTAKPTISYVGVSEYENWLKTGISNYKK